MDFLSFSCAGLCLPGPRGHFDKLGHAQYVTFAVLEPGALGVAHDSNAVHGLESHARDIVFFELDTLAAESAHFGFKIVDNECRQRVFGLAGSRFVNIQVISPLLL